jgi:hypothetical protein
MYKPFLVVKNKAYFWLHRTSLLGGFPLFIVTAPLLKGGLPRISIAGPSRKFIGLPRAYHGGCPLISMYSIFNKLKPRLKY